MPKIVYQYMIDPKIYSWIIQKQKQYRHKTISDTLNYIFHGIATVEQMEKKKKEKSQEQKKTKKSVLDQMEEKYGLKRYE